jgi:hypothetical protein
LLRLLAAILLWAEDGAGFPEGRCNGAHPRTHIYKHTQHSTGAVKLCWNRDREISVWRAPRLGRPNQQADLYVAGVYVYMKALLQEAGGRMLVAKGNVLMRKRITDDRWSS